MKKFFSTAWPWLFLIIIWLLAIVQGYVPQESVFALTAFIALALVMLPLPGALVLFLAALPLSPALPFPGFESFAVWRLWILVLFAVWWFKKRPSLRTMRLEGFEWIALALLGVMVLSLAVAQDPISGLRKIIFLINAALIYPIIRSFAEERVKVLSQGIAGAAAIVFGGAAIQYFLVQVVSLFEFWHGWAGGFIPLFYGKELSTLLSESNTWFSYYNNAPPALRLFSFFPDSHSFALFSVIVYIAAWWGLRNGWLSKKIGLVLVLSAAIALFLSGSRGVWAAAAAPLLVVIGLWLARFAPLILNRLRIPSFSSSVLWRALMLWGLLIPAFAVSSFLTAHARGADVPTEDETAAFKRARTIFDATELSNKSRIQIWLLSLQSIKMYPWLGVGSGNYAVVLGEDVAAARRGASAHNLYLDSAAEAGLLAGILVFVFFLDVFVYALRHGHLIFSLLFSWIAAYNLVDVVLINDRVFIVFAAILALMPRHHD